MGGRRIDRDHEIERHHRARRMGEIAELARQVEDGLRGSFEFLQIRRARAELQARERDAGHGEERRQMCDIERAPHIVRMFRITAPHDADLEAAHRREAIGPTRQSFRRRTQIRHLRRDRLEARLEEMRQAHQGAVASIRRRIAAIAENVDAGQALPHQAHELLMHAQTHLAGTLGEQRNVAGELQRVAEPLLGLDIDVPAGEAFALPRAFGKARPLALGRTQPPFVFRPAFGEVAVHQQQYAEARMRIGMVRRKSDGAAQDRHRLRVNAVVVQRGAEIGPGIAIGRIERGGTAIGVDRRVETLEAMQRVAEIAMRLSEIGIGGDRPAIGAHRFFIVLQFEERGTEIAPGERHGGIDRDRAAAFFDRPFEPAGLAIHFAEIGVK
jgi:hypothetical protein